MGDGTLDLRDVCQVKDLQGKPVVFPGIVAGMPDQILGFPVVICDGMPAVSAGNIAVLFGNFRRGYVITDRIQIRILPEPVQCEAGGFILRNQEGRGRDFEQ